jgi:hypothetical protein
MYACGAIQTNDWRPEWGTTARIFERSGDLRPREMGAMSVNVAPPLEIGRQ